MVQPFGLKAKHDVFGSRSRRFDRSSLSSCLAVARRYLVLATYATAVAAVALFLYCALLGPDSLLWCRRSEDTGARGRQRDSFVLMRDRERASYDSLMHYILHPRAPCLTSRVVGGRSGRNGRLDGDKVVCLEPGPGLRERCIVYSFGIANEWSFDEDMRRRFGCSVYAFDPSMGVGDHLHSDGVRFYSLGIGEFDGKVEVEGREWEVRSFESILRRLGHQNETVDLLKLDIEGAEYVVLEDMLDKGLLNHVNHLCLEIHLPDNPYWTRVLHLLKRIELEAGLRHFSTRNNTQMPKLRVPGFFARYEQHFFEMAWYRQ